MQLRCLHATSFSFAVQDHDPDSERRSGASADLDGSLVVFVAVERRDAKRVAEAGAEQITEMADQLNEQTVAFVPCAQLTDDPASTAVASELIDALAAHLDFDTHTIPVGVSVAFDLDARGHPFASQRFEIDPARRNGEWFRLAAEGSVSTVDSDAEPLLADDHLLDSRPVGPLESGPPLFSEDDTLLPEGVFLRERLLDLATTRLRAFGALPVERSGNTPTLPLSSADSVFETTPGEGPMLTTAVSAPSEALAEAQRQTDLVSGLLEDCSLDFEVVCRATEGFLDDQRSWLGSLSAASQPLLLERVDQRDPQCRLEFVVSDGHFRLVSPAVWIDDTDHETAVRSTPLDDPTRFVAALSHQTAAAERPQLPTWLAPIQLRLVPIEPGDTARCDRLADDLESAGVRVDIDDRDIPVSERLGTADEQWLPFDAVVGADDDKLRVTSRADQTEQTVTVEEFAARVEEEMAGWPDGARPLPRRYNDRPAELQ